MEQRMHKHTLLATVLLLANRVLVAAPGTLPTPAAPSTGQSDNWLDVIQGYIKDGGQALALTISLLGFLWIGYTVISKFNEARTGRAEWAEVGLTSVIGAVVLLFVGFLLNASFKIFT